MRVSFQEDPAVLDVPITRIVSIVDNGLDTVEMNPVPKMKVLVVEATLATEYQADLLSWSTLAANGVRSYENRLNQLVQFIKRLSRKVVWLRRITPTIRTVTVVTITKDDVIERTGEY